MSTHTEDAVALLAGRHHVAAAVAMPGVGAAGNMRPCVRDSRSLGAAQDHRAGAGGTRQAGGRAAVSLGLGSVHPVGKVVEVVVILVEDDAVAESAAL